MMSKLAVAAVAMIAMNLPCHAQSAVEAVALLTWGASPSKYYELVNRTPTSVEYHDLSESSPVTMKVAELSKCKFSIDFQETKYSGHYAGTLDYTTPQWSNLLNTRMKMIDGSLGFQIVHVPGARYCHTTGFSPVDYNVQPGACRDFAAVVLEGSTAAGINALKKFCPGAEEQPTPAPAALPTQPAVKARVIPGQWVFTPESNTSSKLVWQYTPGDSEFLAISFSCNLAKGSSVIVVDLSLEKLGKGAKGIMVTLVKGDHGMRVTGNIRQSQSGPFVEAPGTYAGMAQFLDQPGDIFVTLPHHKLSFSSKSLARPYAAFTKACQQGAPR